MQKMAIVGIVGLALLWAAPGVAQKCESNKVKTAGQYAFCRMKADAKAIRKGEAPNYAKCDEKFSKKWLKLDEKGGVDCPVLGDEAAILGQAADCSDGLSAAIGGNPPAGCVADLVECSDELTSCEETVTECSNELVTCEEDLVAAELCGNGAMDAGEDCDLGTLDGETCASQGFGGGVLSCANGCTFDVSGCFDDRFVDNEDGTITDNVSGLMWEKKTELNSTANGANPHDADNTYGWAGSCSVATSKRCQPNAAAAAECAANVEGDPTGCDECTGGEGTCTVSAPAITTAWDLVAELNADSFAGYNDWRMPTLQELVAIVDYAYTTPPTVDVAFHGASCGAACTDLTDPACSCTRSFIYWSAYTYAPVTNGAWIVDFDNGYVFADFKTLPRYVRAVRGGS